MGAAYDEALFNLFASGIGSFGLVQAHVVGAVLFVRIVLLNAVILPAAHFANIKAAGLREEIFSAHGAGVRVKLEPAGLADMVLTNLVLPHLGQNSSFTPYYLPSCSYRNTCLPAPRWADRFSCELCEHICGDRTSGVATAYSVVFRLNRTTLPSAVEYPSMSPPQGCLRKFTAFFSYSASLLAPTSAPCFLTWVFSFALEPKPLQGSFAPSQTPLSRASLPAALRVTARAGASVSA